MKLLNTFIILCIVGFSTSCAKNDSGKQNEANLLKVTSTFGDGIIDTPLGKVTLKAPESTDISLIIPQFEISNNATIYPPSGVAIDFTNPVVFTITSGDKATKYVFTVTVIKPIVKFTVYDCSNWSPTNFRVLQANAVIKIYTSATDVGTTKTYDVLTTDQNAQATLYGLKTNSYYFTVDKDNKSNINNGYVLNGRYNSQADIDSSPHYAAAVIGGLKYMDVNHDAWIDANDKYIYDRISSDYQLINKPILLKDVYITNKI